MPGTVIWVPVRTVGLKSAPCGSSRVPKLESQLVTRHTSLVTCELGAWSDPAQIRVI